MSNAAKGQPDRRADTCTAGVLELARLLATSADQATVLETALRVAARLLHAPYARIWLRGEAGDLYGRASYAADPAMPARLDRLPLDTVAGLVVGTGRSVALADVTTHHAWRDHAFSDRTGLHVYFGAPIERARERLGVLEVIRSTELASDHPDTAALEVLANLVGVAVDEGRTLARLRQREQECLALVEYTPDAISRVDRHGRFVYVNPALERIAGASAAALRGKTLHDLGASEALAGAWEVCLRQVFDTARELTTEFRLPGGNGELHFLARLVPELGPEGSVEYVFCIARDISERRRAEQERADVYRELVDQQRRLSRLADQVLAHREPQANREPTAAPSLTPREAAVLQLMIRGLTNPEIGRELHVSTATVKTHMTAVLAKLHASDRTQAAVRAIALGLATPHVDKN